MIYLVLCDREVKHYLYGLFRLALEILMHPNQCTLLDYLQLMRQLLSLRCLQFEALSELRKACNNEVPRLFQLFVARNEEHILRDATLKHFLACDAVVAKGQENPRDVGLDGFPVEGAETVEELHDSLIYQKVD